MDQMREPGGTLNRPVLVRRPVPSAQDLAWRAAVVRTELVDQRRNFHLTRPGERPRLYRRPALYAPYALDTDPEEQRLLFRLYRRVYPTDQAAAAAAAGVAAPQPRYYSPATRQPVAGAAAILGLEGGQDTDPTSPLVYNAQAQVEAGQPELSADADQPFDASLANPQPSSLAADQQVAVFRTEEEILASLMRPYRQPPAQEEPRPDAPPAAEPFQDAEGAVDPQQTQELQQAEQAAQAQRAQVEALLERTRNLPERTLPDPRAS
jgi:hypothetical protein